MNKVNVDCMLIFQVKFQTTKGTRDIEEYNLKNKGTFFGIYSSMKNL